MVSALIARARTTERTTMSRYESILLMRARWTRGRWGTTARSEPILPWIPLGPTEYGREPSVAAETIVPAGSSSSAFPRD